MSANAGVCYLVGAGPGDPRLITVRGLELLRTADVILYDALVNPLLLRESRPDALVENVGKRFGKESAAQDQINNLLIAHARSGRSVVRLKGGDPMTFGRGGEELEALADAGVPYEVVPGVSSLSAVPAYAGIPLTHRGKCSEFFAMTATRETAPAEFARLSAIQGTRVLFMGVSQLETCVREMLTSCADPTTPVAVIQWGTRGMQRCVTGDLASIVNVVRSRNITQPALVIFGDVVRLRSRLGWWESLPLAGLHVLLTASESTTTRKHVSELITLGAEVGWEPLIETQTVQGGAVLENEKTRVLLFTSGRAVEIYFEILKNSGRDLRFLADCHIVACGGPVRTALRDRGLVPDAEFAAGQLELVAEHLDDVAGRFDGRVVWYCGDLSNKEWVPVKKAQIDQMIIYKTRTRILNEAARERLLRPWDVVIFLSPSAVRAWLDNELERSLCRTALAVGPRTEESLRRAGFSQITCPDQADWSSVLDKLRTLSARQ